MKKLAIISAIAMSGLFYNAANAQIGIRVGINLFPHRMFAPRPVVVVQTPAPVYQEPVVSENDDCDFYYLPDVGAYYSVDEQCYYYLDGDNWISAAYLPGIYHDFDWRYARRFEINQARPYLHNDFYRDRYKGVDRDIAHNHDNFRGGFDYRNNNYAYNNNGQRFDNRGGYGQRFDNNRDSNQHFDNRNQNNFGQASAGNYRDNNRGGQQANQNYNRGNNNGRQVNQNQNRGSRDNQQRIAQNNNGYNGHNNDKRDRF